MCTALVREGCGQRVLPLLLQVHTIGELERVLKLDLDPATTLLGINNRDLQTFEVTLENTRIIMESPAGQQVRILIRGGIVTLCAACAGLVV